MLKGNDKSFSDVILELKENENFRKGSKESVLRFAGGLKDLDIDWEAKEKRMKEFRKEFDRRIGETSEYMEEARIRTN